MGLNKMMDDMQDKLLKATEVCTNLNLKIKLIYMRPILAMASVNVVPLTFMSISGNKLAMEHKDCIGMMYGIPVLHKDTHSFELELECGLHVNRRGHLVCPCCNKKLPENLKKIKEHLKSDEHLQNRVLNEI